MLTEGGFLLKSLFWNEEMEETWVPADRDCWALMELKVASVLYLFDANIYDFYLEW